MLILGANINFKDQDNITALIDAVISSDNWPNNVKLLLDRSADTTIKTIKASLGDTDLSGLTAEEIARKLGYTNVIAVFDEWHKKQKNATSSTIPTPVTSSSSSALSSTSTTKTTIPTGTQNVPVTAQQ